MRLHEPRWSRYVKAAVGDPNPGPPEPRRAKLRRQAADLHRRLAAAHQEQADAQELRRPDIRILPTVIAVWATAGLATAMPPTMIPRLAMALVLVLLLGLLPGLLLALLRPAQRRGSSERRRARRGGVRGATFVLAAACALAVVAVVGVKVQAGASSPLAQTVAQGEELMLTLEVGATPRRLDSGNGPPRFILDAVIVQASAGGRSSSGRLPVQVIAGPAWEAVRQGQKVGTAGKVDGGPGTAGVAGVGRAGILRPATVPLAVPGAAAGKESLVTAIRRGWIAAVQGTWAKRSPEAAALLPGMVMGDRSAMDSALNESMKTAGLTHLTAVSGANCTLILASLMIGLRSLHTPRRAAFGFSLAALLGFVLVVGPDPSVLRAAVMGALGLMALLSGRPKRVGALLALSIVLLLLADPWLAGDYAFILSVLATLGLFLVGQRCVRWLSVLMPLWLAQTIAIPLAAQLFCAPVIVLLQARLTPYTVPANMLAAPVIALVTTVGTLGMACALLLPPLAGLCAAISGVGAWWVAAVARWMAALPAASLPWPGGPEGVLLMAVLNAGVLLSLIVLVEKQRLRAAIAGIMAHLPVWWRERFGFASVVALAALLALWWVAAVVRV
ncbi:ComEC/Rec2 family competence protein [Arthrobacter sp. PAMC 25486]|uniref:ComEC/Rec2 family competence protein n=1 Tax=Arthrobacter sp. PAMC 25486 TaxID=1494608 RepID=UPI0012FEE6D7|nr:ComEC/Rec2 family competence protein [Arthrobacter sp. PAMC 25486]